MKSSDPYPDWQTYEILYHKYLWSRDPAELFDIALQTKGGQHRDEQCLKGKACLDLCAGTGRLSREIIQYGGIVGAIEKEARMLKPSNFKFVGQFVDHRGDSSDDLQAPFYTVREGVSVSIDTVENAFKTLKYTNTVNFDLAFCQQAANIWLTPDTVNGLADIMKVGGTFVFTTFNSKPSKKPRVSEYREHGRDYAEVVWLSERSDVDWRDKDEWVDHIQICEGYPPHYTAFRWIAADEYDTMLSKRFNVFRIRENKTDFYRCVKF